MALKNEKKISANYLDYIPVPAKGLKYEVEDGKVTIFQENTGMFNWIAQKLWKKPRISQIHLDEIGNFIWPLMDGNNSLMDISVCMKEEFGEKAEPLYNRVVQYFKTLSSYGFVEYINNTTNTHQN